jgi:transcriptional regulator with XRE-family HTH domain
MNFEAMSERAVLEELGRRLQDQRLNENLAQAEVAHKVGIPHPISATMLPATIVRAG